MKKILLIQWLLVCGLTATIAQVNFKDTSLHVPEIEWDNYSTTYFGDGSDSIPFIITAIPYNGVYEHEDEYTHTPLNMTFSGSGYRFRSHLTNGVQHLYTYDSGAVYFLVPGIFAHNAEKYEFKVSDSDGRVIKPWGAVTTFTDSSFTLFGFRKGFGFLGGFSTSWDHYLVIELRRKGDSSLLATAQVTWASTRPILQASFTSGDLAKRILSVTNDYQVDDQLQKMTFGPDAVQATTGLPQKWIVEPEQERLIFQGRAKVYKKGTMEYRVFRNGSLITDWTGNKANNSYIWLDNPGPGDYVLEMRYRKQRHNVTQYNFTVKPAWYQTWTFIVIVVILKLAFVGFLILLFKLRKQRRKTAAEQAKKERFEQGLRSVYAQLNPHFTFNALSSIQGLINSGDIRGANNYLSEFGSLLRHSLADSETPSVPLQRELQTLDTYLKLEKLRFNFTYDIQVAAAMPVSETEIPSLLLQPLAENAVKHGVSTLKENGLIRVEVLQVQKDMVIRISDNGPGFKSGKETTGYGLKLTRDRIALLNELAGTEQIQMHLKSTSGKGIMIELLFKNWLA
jgi:anti-sigma regulatory factor (Ser/Thr protein kinase)/uncharacterized membrane protein